MIETPFLKEDTASFDVDAQKGFTPLCPAELPVPGGDEIVDALNRQAEFTRIRVGSKDAHNRNAIWIANEENPQFSNVDGKDVDVRWNAHCIMGEEGAELLPGLPAIDEYDFFVWKGMEPDMHPYSACYHDLSKKMSTGVIEYLKINNIKTVIVGGLATNYCCMETCLDLADHFKTILNLESCRGIGDISEAITKMKNKNIIIIDTIKELL